MVLASTLAPFAGVSQVEFDPELEFVERVWDQQAGATSNRINDVIESEQGFLWMATYEGVVRYDGLQGRLFSERDHPSLLGGAVLLTETKPGHIWALATGGFLIRIVQNEVTAWEIAELVSDPDSVRLERDWMGRLVILSSSGIFTVDASGSVVPYELPQNMQRRTYRTLLFDSEQQVLWVADVDGNLWKLNDSGASFFDLTQMGTPGPLIYSIYPNDDGSLWLAVSGYIARFDPSKGSLEVMPEQDYYLPHRRVRFARKRHADGPVLLGTISSPLYAIRKGEIEPVTTASEVERIVAMTELTNGGFALATYHRGLVLLQPSRVKAFHGRNGFFDEIVNAVDDASDGGWWVATASGVFHFDGTTFRPVERNGEAISTYSVDLMEDSRGRLWIATLGEGALMFDGERWTQISTEQGLFSSSVRCFAEDQLGRIWIGTISGVHCWDGEIIRSLGVEQGLHSPYLLSMHVDAYNRIWASTNSGLYRIDGVRAVEMEASQDVEAPYVSRTFFSMNADSRSGSIGGMAGGVVRVEGENASFLDLYQALNIASVFHVLDDGLGHHWVTSSRGLFRLNSEELYESLESGQSKIRDILHVDSRDGLPSDAIRSISRVHREGAKFWIPAERGFFLLDAETFEISRHVPDAWIDEVEVNGKLLEGGFPLQKGSLRSEAGLRRLQFRYTAPYFGEPSSVLFETRLVGFEEHWRETTLREVSYTNLAPGEYRFEVRAISRTGSVGDHATATFELIVPAQFYETVWFYLIIGSVVVCLLYGVVHWRLRYMRQSQLRLERIVEDRTREIEARKQELAESNTRLHDLVQLNKEFMGIAAHDLRNPTAAVISLAELLEEELVARGISELREYSEGIRISANNMSFLIRNLLDVNRLDEGKAIARLTAVHVGKVVQEVLEQSHEAAERKRIRMDCEEADFADLQVMADRGFLAQVLDNFVSNAIKYSNMGSVVKIGCRVHEDQLRVEVVDEGPGLTREDQERLFEKFARLSARPTGGETSSGLGLSIAKRLTELMKGRIGCDSERGRGSVFWVELPRA
ncbi:MAG: ATP-binding protein [Puniceicoccaceae bacterium]